ncbi:MAG: dienelactone hydrolase family protein [Pseudomonadota bacterium]|nr:dienelactone hydrolase family protein [Pseudomonadota bacterium]
MNPTARKLLAAVVLALSASPAYAEMQARTVEWKVGDDTFSGVLVYDDASDELRPGLVMVPDWLGVRDDAVTQAKHVAGDDYVVLLADLYGKEVRPDGPEQARAQTSKLYAAPAMWRARVGKALEVLRANASGAPLDASRLGAFGYCFGGAAVLELARSGADIAGVVTFHGGLSTELPAEKGAVKASVLVLNGADDRGTAGDIAGFQEEMNAAGVDWQFVNFSDTVHCFALPHAKSPPGCVYNPLSAKRAENMMDDFFEERFEDDAVSDRD